MCNDKFDYRNYEKLKDHCHFTGKYRSAMHSICRYSVPIEIPFVLHNGSNMTFT